MQLAHVNHSQDYWLASSLGGGGVGTSHARTLCAFLKCGGRFCFGDRGASGPESQPRGHFQSSKIVLVDGIDAIPVLSLCRRVAQTPQGRWVHLTCVFPLSRQDIHNKQRRALEESLYEKCSLYLYVFRAFLSALRTSEKANPHSYLSKQDLCPGVRAQLMYEEPRRSLCGDILEQKNGAFDLCKCHHHRLTR